MPNLVYLHGFASGPQGNKGRHCRSWAEGQGVTFHAPDLNLPDFEHLTITAQVQAVEALLAGLSEPAVMVGSSLGGLVAAAVAHRGAVLRGLILLAPAFGFARRRLVGPRWSGYRKRGTIPVFHHAQNAWMRLGPGLLNDLPVWRDDERWTFSVPTVILHGLHDASVPIAESRAFAARHPACRLQELDDDHALLAPATLALLDQALEEAFGIIPKE
jgi:uncharacterized protein